MLTLPKPGARKPAEAPESGMAKHATLPEVRESCVAKARKVSIPIPLRETC